VGAAGWVRREGQTTGLLPQRGEIGAIGGQGTNRPLWISRTRRL